jgi:hypothetical protein
MGVSLHSALLLLANIRQGCKSLEGKNALTFLVAASAKKKMIPTLSPDLPFLWRRHRLWIYLSPGVFLKKNFFYFVTYSTAKQAKVEHLSASSL